MKFLPFIISLVWVTSCKQNNPITIAESDAVTLLLIDTLGSIFMSKPDQSDTFFTWIRRNDCGKTCEEGKYRFQPKNLPIFKESGFFWTGQPEDSVNQLTISHSRPYRLGHNNDSFAIKQYARLKENLESDPETANIISDTIQKIGDRYFGIFQIADIDKRKGVLIRRLIGITAVSGVTLQFRYDLLTKKRDSVLKHFFDN